MKVKYVLVGFGGIAENRVAKEGYNYIIAKGKSNPFYGQALTGAIAAPLLIAMGYVANQAQAPATVNGINALVNIAPAVMLVVAMLPIIFKYRLDEKTMEKITAELTERRAVAAAEVQEA